MTFTQHTTLQIDLYLATIPHSSGVGFKDIIVIRTPTRHCFFNPIELIWAWVKGFVAANNATYKIKDVLELTQLALKKVS